MAFAANNLTISWHIWLFSDENITNNILAPHKSKKEQRKHLQRFHRFHNETKPDLEAYTKPLISLLNKQ